MNSRLDTIQAAILQVKFKHFIQYELDKTNETASWYTQMLNGSVITPVVVEGFSSCWAQYTILCKEKEQRDKLQNELKEEDIPIMIYYKKGIHEQLAFKQKAIVTGNYENTNYLTERVLSIPIHAYMDIKDMKKIIEVIQYGC